MEEEKNENLKKNNLLSKQNNLEKIIKLDQKNSSQSLFTKVHRRRLLIRDQALSSTFSWTPNPTEQSLYAFWSHINQYYYKPLKEDDLERVDLLMQGTPLDDKSEPPKYTGIESYEAFKDIVAPEYKKLYQDQSLSNQNYENLRMKYYLSTFKLAKSIKGLKPSTNPPSFSYDVAALKSAKSKGKIKGFLQEETKQLEGFKNKIENKNDNKSDFLDEEIQKFTTEFRKVSKDNVKNLLNLKHKAEKKEHILDMNEIIESSRTRTPNKDKWSSSNRKAKDKNSSKNILSTESIKTTFVQYLRGVVIKLENQQTAESIKYVVDCKKPTTAGEPYKFCVIFDEAIRSTESWVEEPVLDKLDKLREQSLFKVYKIPQKIHHSVNSHNLAAFYHCDQKISDKTLSLKDKPWKDLIKKGFLEGTKGFSKEELFLKSKEFALCHHCKYLFPEEFLVKCTYRSTDLKLPQSNSEYMNSLAYNGNIPKRSMWNNKRTAASFYQKRNGDNVCLRAYCRLCLKQNFDAQMVESAHKPNWICPFCTGICNCTRCLRYDTLNKLMSLFSILGGDLDDIKKESYSEKYIYGTGVEVPLDKAYKKTSYYALKPTRGAKSAKDNKEVKGKLDIYKGNLERYQALKELRIKLEKMRILCSQVAKRERMKIRLDALKNKILEEYVDKAKNVIDSKTGKRIKPDFDFADLEPFKIKKMKLSPMALKIVQNGLTPVKRKRGRPRKDASLLSDFDILTPFTIEKKGKRGRKKKEVVEENKKSYIRRTSSLGGRDNDKDQKKMILAIPAKKRGRPRKADKEKELAKLLKEQEKEEKKQRRRRQKGERDDLYEPEDTEEEGQDEDEDEFDEEDEDDEDLSEEGTDEEEEEENDLDSGEEMEEEEEPVKRKVGRPRKLPVPMPRPRGRPPKAKAEVKKLKKIARAMESEDSSEDDVEEDEEQDESGDDEDEEDNEDEDESEAEEDEDQEENEEDEEDMEEEEDEDEEDSVKVPRELQGILSYQNSDQFNVFTKTLNSGRVTRSLYHSKKRGRPRKSKSKRA